MTPKRKKPVLTSLIQLFTRKTLKELSETSFLKSHQYNWGVDRIVSIVNKDTSVKSQIGNTCTGYSTIAALENKLGGTIDLSENSLWSFYQAYSLEKAIGAAEANLILENRYWPEHQNHPTAGTENKGRFQLKTCVKLDRDYSKVLNAIDNGNPCVVALNTPKDLAKYYPQVEATSALYLRKGHALCVSGYKVENGKGYFLVKNSWGPDIGLHGYQYIAFAVYDVNGYIIFWEVDDVYDKGEQKR
ncbi:hypothetical protein KXD93_25565 [Mucilaginibacter sp. BJC16-A38]|uniref:C1 family peptidase n=1 Tax=Mucilaginibacter phenanthrenivorans TaxID=1234842 RepID=UPI002158914B|nr:C1 family peptidase [Mucilaginibacter phenanthrenivorans]MCR8561051.1 hypothetical protein [Mucilaginibacter phenanthrenivorans]